MATGRIQCYFPATRSGIVKADTGREFLVSFPANLSDLHGGDVIEYDTTEDGKPIIHQIRLRYRWTEMLNEKYRPLVNAFHQTVVIHT
jgi:hypothetical protein